MTQQHNAEEAGAETVRERNLELIRIHAEHVRTDSFEYEPRLDRMQAAIAVPGTDHYPPGHAARRRRYGAVSGPLARFALFDGGVYDSAGTIVPTAIHLGGGRRHLPAADPPPMPTTQLDGMWLWGGVLHPHFGHFLTESLGRLWAWPRVRVPLQGVVWLVPGSVPPHRAEEYAALAGKSYMVQAFDLLGIQGTHHVLTAPLRIQRLLVPGQLMMNSSDEHFGGHPVFRRFVQGFGQRAAVPEPGRGTRLYVSRAGLDSGRFVLEEELEATFSRAGWSVLRPETLDLYGQIAAYTAAEQLVFAEGSALHLYAMVARPEQKVAILCRRVPVKTKFEQQLRAYGLPEVHTIDAVEAALAPTSAEKGGRRVLVHRQEVDAVLDWEQLGDALDALGFLPRQQWRVPAADKRLFAAAEVALARSVAQPETPYAVIGRAELLGARNERLARRVSVEPDAATAMPEAPAPIVAVAPAPPQPLPRPAAPPPPRPAAAAKPGGLLATLRGLLFGGR